jgi:hypothetical protein
VIEALRTSILVPRDHLHIKQIRTSGVSSHRVARVGLPAQAIVLADWDRCPYGRLLPGELCAGRGKSHSVTTAAGALRADALAKSCRPRLAAAAGRPVRPRSPLV